MSQYNLAFVPVFNTTDESKSRIYFFKCSVIDTGVFNRLDNWKDELLYQCAFSIPFPERGTRYEGKHITSKIATIISKATSIESNDIFFISYLNAVLISTIMSTSVCDNSTVNRLESAIQDYSTISSNELIFEANLEYIIAIGISINSNNLRLLCINRRILKTVEDELTAIPILTFSSYNQLIKIYGDNIIEVSPDVLSNVLNPYNVIIEKFNKLQRLISNISKINKTMSLEITSHDIEQYTRFTRQAIVAELIKNNNGKILSLK